MATVPGSPLISSHGNLKFLVINSPSPFLLPPVPVEGAPSESSRLPFKVNWNTIDKDAYYECTRLKFLELSRIFSAHSLAQLLDVRPDFLTSKGINSLYRNLVHGLINCSLECSNALNRYPKFKGKWWWDDSLRAAKNRAFSLFKVWKEDGNDKESSSYANYCEAKKCFRSAVRKKRCLVIAHLMIICLTL